MQGAVLVCAHALSHAKQLLTRLQQGLELLGDPLDTERVNATHDDVGTLECLGDVLKLVSLDVLVDLQAKIRVHPGLLD